MVRASHMPRFLQSKMHCTRATPPFSDFRVEGRLGTDPTVGPPGGPSLPPGPAAFRDSLGGKSPDEILKSIDKDLGKSSPDRSESEGAVRSLELERELSSPADKIFK